MKRLTALLLSLILALSLCACGVKPGENGKEPDFTEPPVVTLSNGSVVYSKEPFVEYPQTGEYKETALLTNVPGQGVPLLLDMRQDGTVDYLFAGVEDLADFQNFADSGARYYTIAPDGTATEQDTDWMEDLDHYLAVTLETTQDPEGRWRFLFTAEEGTILILGQYHNVRSVPQSDGNNQNTGSFLYNVLFKVKDGMVSIIPLAWEVKLGGKALNLRDKYISSIELRDGQIILSKRDEIWAEYINFVTVTYNMDGSMASGRFLFEHNQELAVRWDATGIQVYSMDQPMEHQVPEWSVYYGVSVHNREVNKELPEKQRRHQAFLDPEEITYTEDDSLYYIGKGLSNMEAITYGTDKDFCCWFDEAGQGVLMRYTYNPEGKTEPEVLTVWSLESIDMIKTAVAQWNHTHGSPIFRYKTAEEEMEGTHRTLEDVLTRLNLELLNGQGPDVMILDGLNVDTYIDFMTPLDRITTGDVYESILSRFTVGGDLLAIPARVSPYLLGRKAEGTEDIESIQQFADIVEANTQASEPMENGRVIANINMGPYYIDDYLQLFQLWYPAWADAIWAGGKLNREVFTEFLTQTTRLSKTYGLQSISVRQGIVYNIDATKNYEENDKAGNLDFVPFIRETDGNMAVFHRWIYPYTLAATNHVGLYRYWQYTTERGANKSQVPHYLDAIPGPDGTGVMVPTVVAGVRAGGNEAAGQEFVQILLSRELQLGGAYHATCRADGYPVTWGYTEELMERTEAYMHQEYVVENDYREVMNSLRTVVIDETLYKMALYAAQHCYRYPPIDESDNPEVIDYNHLTWEVLTPEEATELLDEMSRIYLAELR